MLPKVWNTRPGGILVFAPPCSTWVFLSSSATGRSWSCPEGDTEAVCVKMANIFVRRMIYLPLGHMPCVCTPLRLYYAVKKQVHILVEQPGSSATWL